MPKALFYTGTAFCLFVALTSAGEAVRELYGGTVAFAAVTGRGFSFRAIAAILVALIAGLTAAAMFLRMTSLLAARNLFGAFLGLFSVTGAATTLAWLLVLQSRLATRADSAGALTDMHFAAYMVLGCFVALSFASLRPYFRIQASRFLSALVLFPSPLVLLVVVQELSSARSTAALPASSPASIVLFALFAVLFFSISVHCIRHRHLFIETTNLRELLDTRIDPTGRGARRPLGLNSDVAFDS